MFRKNAQHRQRSFMSGSAWLPDRLRHRLQHSWAGVFYREVFCRIDEETFAVLYSDEMSRPNSPVNVLVGAEIIKSGLGLSDEELHAQVCFNLQVRYALGLDDLGGEVFTLRTLYNFRRRVREYEEETGINLMQVVFEQVTDEQLAAVGIQTGWQRMDSTQVLSNLAQWSRLELLVGVLQKAYGQLPETLQPRWAERLHPYLQGRPHQVCHRIASADQEAHLQALGEQLWELETELSQTAPEHEALALLRRVLDEQFVLKEGAPPQVRLAEEIGAGSLQSPHDPDATYRVKGGQSYRGGYVANVSETADPENPVQLVTDVQVEPNVTDDAQLMKQSLERQTERGVEVTRMTTDGGYTGPTGEAACAAHDVELRATRLRGGKSSRKHWGWEAYEWEQDAEGTPIRVTCPQGVTAELQPGRAQDRFIARFPSASCADCPYRDTQCRIEEGARVGPSLYVKRRAVEVALQRQNLHPEDAGVRTVVEATVREVKHPFAGGKLPVRGLMRARIVIYGSALMVNVRRLHRHFTAQVNKLHRDSSTSDLFPRFVRLSAWLDRFRRRFASFERESALLVTGAY